MSCVEAFAGGIGTSSIEVKRDAVDGYALADERTIESMFSVSSVVGISCEGMVWKRSGCFESWEWLVVYAVWFGKPTQLEKILDYARFGGQLMKTML